MADVGLPDRRRLAGRLATALLAPPLVLFLFFSLLHRYIGRPVLAFRPGLRRAAPPFVHRATTSGRPVCLCQHARFIPVVSRRRLAEGRAQGRLAERRREDAPPKGGPRRDLRGGGMMHFSPTFKKVMMVAYLSDTLRVVRGRVGGTARPSVLETGLCGPARAVAAAWPPLPGSLYPVNHLLKGGTSTCQLNGMLTVLLVPAVRYPKPFAPSGCSGAPVCVDYPPPPPPSTSRSAAANTRRGPGTWR